MSECKCNCSCSGDSSCASNSATKTVYACAGASNVGRYSQEIAIALHQANSHQMSCAAGVGADICGFTDSAKTATNWNLLIDGCPVGCLKTMFDHKGITNYDHIVLTELGVKKQGNFDLDPVLLRRLVGQIMEMGV